ncbi:ankyrin repeat protein [Catovirus CTV1]|uniref:Ankyrin repeat protein n=1 Tax=Catovirus CTV1 TaxID=1977631 RepID=A0A1V0S9I4_9VIRU|nr:ankyrin repeat protein [Catovirus CTV1]
MHIITKIFDSIVKIVLGGYSKKLTIQEKFIEACKNNDIRTVKRLLLKNEIDVNNINGEYCPLIEATKNNNIDLVKILLSYEDINVNFRGLYQPPLLIASVLNLLEIAELLLKHKLININQSVNLNTNALHLACMENNWNMVKILLKYGADCNYNSHNNQTPLILACIRNSYESVKILLEQQNIEVNAKDFYGLSAIHYLCTSNNKKSLRILGLLLNHYDIKINIKDKLDNTPLILLCSQHRHPDNLNIEKAKMLLSRPDIEINAKTVSGYTALSTSIRCDYVNMIKCLLKHEDINVNLKCNCGFSELEKTGKYKSFESMLLLLDNQELNPIENRTEIIKSFLVDIEQRDYLIDNMLLYNGFKRHGKLFITAALSIDCIETKKEVLKKIYFKLSPEDKIMSGMVLKHYKDSKGHFGYFIQNVIPSIPTARDEMSYKPSGIVGICNSYSLVRELYCYSNIDVNIDVNIDNNDIKKLKFLFGTNNTKKFDRAVTESLRLEEINA